MSLEQALRTFIHEVAEEYDAIGALEESLKWGQPSFTPKKKNIGSSVRLQHNKDGTMSLMFICHTGLVSKFRELYESELTFEGTRAIVVSEISSTNSPQLKHCIAMALTYHLNKSA